ncbi:MAG TPA: DUF86 domain-containing protein [Chloroflexi bacterium]|nr:MAG: DUF86 domain-containing protein [Anaerolineaceae bacterium 4572_5.2]HEY83862.1 DUF86 domain-containing protein [Chloroflexota bacterium]
MKDDRLYLVHISECITRIEEYTDGKEQKDFLDSYLIQDAVLRNLQVLAESTQRLSPEIKNAHPDIPWRQIAGFRNILVHDYLGINLKQIWLLVEKDLPDLISKIDVMRRELGAE